MIFCLIQMIRNRVSAPQVKVLLVNEVALSRNYYTHLYFEIYTTPRLHLFKPDWKILNSEPTNYR